MSAVPPPIFLPIGRAELKRAEIHARDRKTDVASLIRSVLTVADPAMIAAEPDMEPGPNAVNLPLRLSGDWPAETLRKALSLALRLGDGRQTAILPRAEIDGLETGRSDAEQRAERALEALEKVAFRPFPSGVRTLRQAAHALGFSSEFGLDEAAINARFRLVAPVYHPDTGLLPGSERIGQLVEARRMLIEAQRER